MNSKRSHLLPEYRVNITVAVTIAAAATVTPKKTTKLFRFRREGLELEVSFSSSFIR